MSSHRIRKEASCFMLPGRFGRQILNFKLNLNKNEARKLKNMSLFDFFFLQMRRAGAAFSVISVLSPGSSQTALRAEMDLRFLTVTNLSMTFMV